MSHVRGRNGAGSVREDDSNAGKGGVGMSRLWREHVVFTACLAALVAFPLLSPPAAFAAHDGGESCYNCHTLDESEGDANSSYINKLSRTFPRIKDYDGLPADQTPANLGCTYCHNDNGNATAMKTAITHFQGRTSFHPVGYNFSRRQRNDQRVPQHVRLGHRQRAGLRRLPRPGELGRRPGRPRRRRASTRAPTTTRRPRSAARRASTPSTGGRSTAPTTPSCSGTSRWPTSTTRSAAPATTAATTLPDSQGVILQLLSHADNAAGRPLRRERRHGAPDRRPRRQRRRGRGGAGDDRAVHGLPRHALLLEPPALQRRARAAQDRRRGWWTTPPVTSGNCTGVCHYAGDR